jgi:glycosyltransferase involved in cell wall biosynthesis
MRIGLNALLCSSGRNYRRTGVSRYIDELIRHLALLNSGSELIAYTNRNFEVDGWDSVRLRRAAIPVGNPTIRIGWELVTLPVATVRDRLDVFHGTVNALPRGIRAATAVTVHDLAFLRYPEQVTGKRYRYLKWVVETSIRRANIVLTPSEATRADVIEAFAIGPDRVVATPLGVDERFRPASPESIESVRSEYRLERPYILTVGTLEPRKNLPMLVRAFAVLKDEIPHDLVLAGPAGWLMDDIERTIVAAGIDDRVRRIGFADDLALVALYSGAEMVAIPSLYEGFGLPVIEAMATGAPVLTSDVSSMPEVAGDAALLIDPTDLESIVEGIRRILGSEELRAKMRSAGPLRAAQFTWQRTASETMAAYRRIA